MNAGGVTASYFEWLKNLSHVRFGRMGKRFDQTTFENMLRVVETTTGKKLSDEEIKRIARGADEIDPVNSGLEETMWPSPTTRFMKYGKQTHGFRA